MVEHLATALEPGLTAMPSGRFYGMVIGGAHPAALAADWLVSAWDQNAGLARLTPAATATEQVASAWLLDLLGLPEGSAVGFVTGGTMANFTCLAAGRDAVLRQAGWDVGDQGSGRLARGCGCWSAQERHDTVDLALRYLGLGAPEPVAADDQGRLDARRARGRAGDGHGRPDGGLPPGRQRALRRLRPVRRGDRGRAPARRVGARRRRVRALRGRRAGVPPPHRGHGRRRLVGHRRAQDPQRPLRLRASRSSATRPRSRRRWGCTATT